MTDKPPEPELDDTEAERRFNETLKRMLSTPPQPHAAAKPKDKKRGSRQS